MMVAGLAVGVAAVLGTACGAGDKDTSVSIGDASGGFQGTPPQLSQDVQKSVNTEASAQPASGQPVSAGTARSNATTAQGSGGGTAPELPATFDRKVISNTSLALSVGDVGAAFNEAGRLARVNGGYTEKSSYTNPDNADAKHRSASLTLRVPAAHYDELLASLRGISGAKVVSEGAKSTEITEQYTDLQSRMRNLERTEQSYLKLLEQAKSIQEILTVNDRLDNVRAQIEQIQGRLKVFDNLADLATVDLTISPLVPAQAPQADGPKSAQTAFADAWDWSMERARYVLAGGVVASVALIWLAIPLVVVVIGARVVRRRGPTAA
jgi:hypothetical protein